MGGGISKKQEQKSKKKTTKNKPLLKTLHSALKNLLDTEQNSIPEKHEKKTPIPKNDDDDDDDDDPVLEKNGIIYVRSKENYIIPKLTDDEVMERHKRADYNMKEVWTSIISKYEGLESQGDVIDLQTGEIIEDAGHLRNLHKAGAPLDTKNVPIRYKSILKDLIDIPADENDDGRSIWQSEDDSEEDADYVDEESSNESPQPDETSKD